MSGLEDKYYIEPKGDEDGVFFVLDVKNDPYARTALMTYADSIRYEDYDYSERLIALVDQYDD